jgi:hypothetical protein
MTTYFLTYATTGKHFENVVEHQRELENLLIVSPFQIKNCNTVDVPFAKVTNQMDIFWRLIYALPDDASSFVFVSPSLQNVNYELLKKLSVVDSDVYFIDDSIDCTFGKKISYCAFKMIRNSHAYACFKTMEFAFSHKEDFSKFVYAPDRLNITDEIQYIFSHSIIDDTTMILNKRELCLL